MRPGGRHEAHIIPGRARSRPRGNPDRALFAWTGAGVFVLSLGYFLYSYWIVFGRTADGPLAPRAVVVECRALFSVCRCTTACSRGSPSGALLTRAFPRLERSVYVWVASLLFIAVCWLWQPVAGVVWELEGPARIAAGHRPHRRDRLLGVQRVAHRCLRARRHPAAQLPTPNARTPNAQRPTTCNAQPEEFKTTGPYGWVRHPIYLGWFLIVFAVGTMTMTRFVFAVVSCAYILVAIPFEERSHQSVVRRRVRALHEAGPQETDPGPVLIGSWNWESIGARNRE